MAAANNGDDEKPNYTVPARKYGFAPEAFDWSRLPDVDTNFLPAEHLEAFIQALSAPDFVQSPDDASSSASVFRLGSASSPGSARKQSSSSFDFGSSNYNNNTGVKGDINTGNERESAAQAGDVAAPGTPRRPHVQIPPTPLSRTNSGGSIFISARNDWAPVHEKIPGSAGGGSGGGRDSSSTTKYKRYRDKYGKLKPKRLPHVNGPLRAFLGTRSKDETREGYLYSLLKWPFLFIVGTWLLGLSVLYLATRMYIYLYEQFVAWRGRREKLRRAMRATGRYRDWVVAAKQMDDFFGNGKWKEENEFAYYDSKTVRRAWDQMRKHRERAEREEGKGSEEASGNGGEAIQSSKKQQQAAKELMALVEACVKNNFVGIENPRLYSQTYYGTKNLVQNYVDEVEKSINFLIETKQISQEDKRVMFKGISANYGRTALCLSGGATFAYYHFGVIRALLDEDLLPDIITGTSGGALVAALVATRTNEELKELIVPALARKITACREPISVWFRRWWKTGARFDSIDWAKQCSWWTMGSMTFREAYERTGRILNVSCVPADPHSPTILCNYLTSPDCVIWSAVIASAAVPGILNPVVLMMKTRGTGELVPYSFGHKWKDGSLRTDIPIKALNLHFNVNFTIVSQVNPHINLFFFSSRGSVGSPVTHRKGRGWRGGYLGSAMEQYIKLDLTKWLKVLRQLELLPRPLGQDWSQLWLQQFGGTVTIWPKSKFPSDFFRILTDPDPPKLAQMIHEGQQSAFPKVKFVSNRLKVERLIEKGRRLTRVGAGATQKQQLDSLVAAASGGTSNHRRGSIESLLSEDELLKGLLRRGGAGGGGGAAGAGALRRRKGERMVEGVSGGSTTEGTEDEFTATDVENAESSRHIDGAGEETEEDITVFGEDSVRRVKDVIFGGSSGSVSHSEGEEGMSETTEYYEQEDASPMKMATPMGLADTETERGEGRRKSSEGR